jgi:hypothetical protein
VRRLAHLAPEEIAGTLLLAVALVLVALRPAALTDRFVGEPYATPVPGGGPGLQFLREGEPTPAPTPASLQIGTPSTVVYDRAGEQVLYRIEPVRPATAPLRIVTR